MTPTIPEPRRPSATTGHGTPQRLSPASGTAAAGLPPWKPTCPTRPRLPILFDTAEEQFGPVDILINNATGLPADTFAAAPADRLGRSLQPVTAETWTRQFTVDAMGAALMISEFARRHIARQATWGRIIGLTSGGDIGFPEEVSYGAAKAAQENYTMSAAIELAPFGITANMVHPPVTDTGWVTDAVREHVAANPGLIHIATPTEVGRGDCLPRLRRRRPDHRERDHAPLSACPVPTGNQSPCGRASACCSPRIVVGTKGR